MTFVKGQEKSRRATSYGSSGWPKRLPSFYAELSDKTMLLVDIGAEISEIPVTELEKRTVKFGPLAARA